MNASAEDPRRPRVAVVFGGRSPEHPISCITASNVVAVIDPAVYDVVSIAITKDGRWLSGGTPDQLSAPGPNGLPEVVPSAGMTVSPAGQPPVQLSEVDVVLPLLHGAYGEDGTVQGLLEMADVRYVGAGVLASAVAMDKDVMKTLLAAAGVPVCRWVSLSADRWARQRHRLTEEISELGWPVFVKPARAGSSFGISRVSSVDDLPAAVRKAAAVDPKMIVEEAVVAREVECGVLQGVDGAESDVSVLGEILVGGGHDFYDFEAKYVDTDGLELRIPADVDAAVDKRARQLAAVAFEALCCEGLARVDFFLTESGTLLLNEVNTMPGFTPVSMFPLVWDASGIDYASLVDRLLTTALRRPLGLR